MTKFSDLKWLFWIVLILILALPIISNFYLYVYTKNFDYLIEAKCDPKKEVCFTRNCEIEDCPPNGLTFYKQFHVKASDFVKCKNDSCEIECQEKMINCIPIPCDVSAGDVCSDESI